jgi:hypothetical protein
MKVQIIDRDSNQVLKEYPLVFNCSYPQAGEEVVLDKTTYKIFSTVHDYDMNIIRIMVSKLWM